MSDYSVARDHTDNAALLGTTTMEANGLLNQFVLVGKTQSCQLVYNSSSRDAGLAADSRRVGYAIAVKIYFPSANYCGGHSTRTPAIKCPREQFSVKYNWSKGFTY